MSYPVSINDLADRQYAACEKKGWHNKTVLEALCLIHSEVSEVAAECRGEKPSDRVGVELADIILRVLDLSVVLSVNIEADVIDPRKLK